MDWYLVSLILNSGLRIQLPIQAASETDAEKKAIDKAKKNYYDYTKMETKLLRKGKSK